jgi:hypothetical protein
MRRIDGRWWALAAGLAIGVLAVAARFYRLTDRSLWLDEIFTATAAHLLDPAQVIAFAKADIDQMPLFYMFTWLMRPWGDGAFVLRLQSVVAGSLAVAAVFLLGRALFGIRAALAASLLMALMPYAVWYSQEARNYALFMLLSTLQMYFSYRALKQSRWFDWAGLAVVSILNLYNHYLALETTAAVALYVSGFLLFDLLRKSSNRLRLATALFLATAVVVAALVPWRPVLRAIYNSASDAVALAKLHRFVAGALVVGLIALLAAVVFAARQHAGTIRSWLRRPPARRATLAVLTGLAVVIAYAPWLPALRVFLSTPSKGFGRLDIHRAPDLVAVASIPVRLGLSGFVGVIFCVGLLALGVWAFRGRSIEAALVISWLTVPLMLLVFVVRWAIVDVDLRYFAFLFPAAMLVVGAGVEAICIGLDRISKRLLSGTRARLAVPLAAALLMTLLALQAVPALATSYNAPKNDWRSVAAHIAVTRSPGSVVLAIGNYSDWSVLCLQYYFREMRYPITVVDGRQITSDVADRLARSNGPTWGVIDYPSAAQQSWMDTATAVKTDFLDATGTIHVIRATDSALSATDQAIQMLRWEIPLEPQLKPSASLLDLQSGRVTVGPNLIQAMPGAGWLLSPGAAGAGATIVLAPTTAAPTANAYFTMSPPPSGSDFMVSFEHRAPSLVGLQTVSALAFDKADQVIAVYPYDRGYVCAPSETWTRSYFAFAMPQGTTSLVLVFQANGRGTAEFRSMQLNSLSDNS